MIWSELLGRVDRWGDRVALGIGDRRIPYAELAEMVEAIARPWAKSGGTSIRRALIKQPDPASVLLYILACWRAGIVPVVMRDNAPQAQVGELAHCLQPELVLLDRIDPDAIALGLRPAAAAPRFRKRDEALVLSTSGSTGVPKLVALPAEAVCINAGAIAASLELTPEDRLVVNTPLTYMYGLMGGTMAGLWSGAAVHLFPSRTPPSVVQARMRRERLTVFQSPPSVYRLFAEYWNGEPFAGVRMVTTGGEYLGEDTADEIRRMFPRARRRFLYGMTEAGPRISHDDLDNGRFARGGIGKPYSHLEWRIDPVDDDLSPAGNAGRLVLRGPSIFLGYLQPATGTYAGLDDDGWFHSSDLISSDADGRLHFCGRTDRLFKSGGKLVNPAAVERILASHPGVRAVRYRSQSHAVLGLVPAAEVAVVPGSGVSESDLQELCLAHLDAHAVPRRITLCHELPVSASGKMELARAA
jgi:acyl-coenzyme A synthetase/AMP-(fatty) acid ligase